MQHRHHPVDIRRTLPEDVPEVDAAAMSSKSRGGDKNIGQLAAVLH